MKIQVRTGICLALLASATLISANAQSANGNPQNTGNKQSTGTAQTNGQRKSGQVVHQDFNNLQSSMPNELTMLAQHQNQNSAQGSGSSNGGEKVKVRQEFGPQQASKRNDVIVPSGSGGNGGKTKTDAKTQSPK